MLDQEAAPGKGQELQAVEEMVKRLDLRGKMSLETPCWRRETSARRSAKKGALLVPPEGQPADALGRSEVALVRPVSPLSGTCQQSRHGNRHEVRTLLVSSDLNEWADWPYLGQVAELTYTCERKGKLTSDTSYLITSLTQQEASPDRLLELSGAIGGSRIACIGCGT